MKQFSFGSISLKPVIFIGVFVVALTIIGIFFSEKELEEEADASPVLPIVLESDTEFTTGETYTMRWEIPSELHDFEGKIFQLFVRDNSGSYQLISDDLAVFQQGFFEWTVPHGLSLSLFQDDARLKLEVRDEVSPPGTTPGPFYRLGWSGEVGPIYFSLSDIFTKNWKTYTDEEFGFSFKYPADLYVSYGKIRRVHIGGVTIDVHPHDDLIFYDRPGGSEFFYDFDLETWLGKSSFEDDVYTVESCAEPFSTNSSLDVKTVGTGDAGHSWSVSYVNTNQDYAIGFGIASDQMTDLDSILETFYGMLQTLEFIPPVAAAPFGCNTSLLDESVLPTLVGPQDGDKFSSSNPLITFVFNEKLPEDIGFMARARSGGGYYYSFGIGEFREPVIQFETPLLREGLNTGKVTSGEMDLEIQFFKVIGDRKFLFPFKARQNVSIDFTNDLPSRIFYRIRPDMAEHFSSYARPLLYSLGDERYHSDMLEIELENVVSCYEERSFQEDRSYVNTSSYGEPFFQTLSVPYGVSLGSLITTQLICETPNGEILKSDVLEFDYIIPSS